MDPELSARRGEWLAIAESLKPALLETRHAPVSIVSVERDDAAFQGWSVRRPDSADSLASRVLGGNEGVTLDFGAYLVGHLTLRAENVERPPGAPLRLRFVFAERPAELGESFDDYRGWLSRAWLQEEIHVVDALPATVRPPRRYAFRYVRIEVADHALPYKVRLSDVECTATSCIDTDDIPPLSPDVPGDLTEIDRVGCITMAACMQTVVEDGTKRDRRMWLGDMRLCALANYATARRFDPIRHCLYLFCGLTDDEGLNSACLYEHPHPVRGEDEIVDYSVQLAPTLLEYAEASGDFATARDLCHVAFRQIEIAFADCDSRGVFTNPKGKWVFVDWNPDVLHTEAAINGMIVACARAAARLAMLCGEPDAAARMTTIADTMADGSRGRFLDETTGVVVSGPDRQVSYASVAWLTIGGVLTAAESRRAFLELFGIGDAIRPVTPSLTHHVVQALFDCGLKDEAWATVRSFWGGMVERGADAFWEVFDADDPMRSPYGSPLMNSYCHAWSAGVVHFIRRAYPPD